MKWIAIIAALSAALLTTAAPAQPRHGGLFNKIPKALWGEYCSVGMHSYVPRVLDMGRQCMPFDYLAVIIENIEYRFGKDKRGKLFVVLVERTRIQ